MSKRHGVVVRAGLLALVVPLAAQQEPVQMARVLRVEGLAKYDAAASAEGAVPTLDRLVAILREALGDGANEKFPLVLVANSARGTICFTRGTQERIAAVQAVFGADRQRRKPRL